MSDISVRPKTPMYVQPGNNTPLLHKDQENTSVRIADEDVSFGFTSVCVHAPVD